MHADFDDVAKRILRPSRHRRNRVGHRGTQSEGRPINAGTVLRAGELRSKQAGQLAYMTATGPNRAEPLWLQYRNPCPPQGPKMFTTMIVTKAQTSTPQLQRRLGETRGGAD